MKKTTHLLLALWATFLIISSCQKDEKISQGISSGLPNKKWANTEIDAFIFKTIEEKKQVFDWSDASDEMLWSALNNSDNSLAVGFKPATASDEDAEKQNASTNANWKAAKNELVQLILENEKRANPTLDFSKFKMGTDWDKLNAFYIRVTSLETIVKLRQSPLVRYIYPSGYSPQEQIATTRGGGCNGDNGYLPIPGFTTPIPGYTTSDYYEEITPNKAKQPWSYTFSNIPAAWSRARGLNVGVMVIDAGASDKQNLLIQSNFASGESASTRKVELISTYPSLLNFWQTEIIKYDPNPYSNCGHGTAAAGIVASPRNNSGASVGVAYNCNLVSCRATEDVIINNNKEELGVVAAITLATLRADIHIISMSAGSTTARHNIGAAIKAFRNAGKLPFCAAGTSSAGGTIFDYVVYPASMDEAIAVTGVSDQYTRGRNCHTGPKVDFTAVMHKNIPNGTVPFTDVLTLAVDVDSNGNNYPTQVGGSSAATPTVAGIAALVWGRKLSQTGNQVLARMKANSQYTGNVNSNFGYGVVNANAATNFVP